LLAGLTEFGVEVEKTEVGRRGYERGEVRTEAKEYLDQEY
jgi:hypothetical protein